MKKAERWIQQITIFYSQVYIFKKDNWKKEGKTHSSLAMSATLIKQIKLEWTKPLGALTYNWLLLQHSGDVTGEVVLTYGSNWGKEHTRWCWVDGHTCTLKNVRIKVKCIHVIAQSTRVHTHCMQWKKDSYFRFTVILKQHWWPTAR